MSILEPALQIAGIAISSEFIGRLMEDNGHGGKVVLRASGAEGRALVRRDPEERERIH